MKIEFAVTFCNKLVELTDSAFYPVKVSARRFCLCVKFSLSKVKYLTSLPTQEAAIHCMVVSLSQTCHTPSFQWPRGQTLKQQFRNGVSEPTVGLVQFSQDIFLIVLDNMATAHEACGIHGHNANTVFSSRQWGWYPRVGQALEASTITLRTKDNCSAPTGVWTLHHPSLHRVKLKRGHSGLITNRISS